MKEKRKYVPWHNEARIDVGTRQAEFQNCHKVNNCYYYRKCPWLKAWMPEHVCNLTARGLSS